MDCDLLHSMLPEGVTCINVHMQWPPARADGSGRRSQSQRISLKPPARRADLRLLDLSGCAIAALPTIAAAPSHLRTLRLARCGLAELPAQVSCLRSLQDLDLSGQSTGQPDSQQQKTLTVSLLPIIRVFQATLFCSIARGLQAAFIILELGSLSEFALVRPDIAAAGNELPALPPEIGSLRELKFLNVMGNRLRSLPDEIGQLNKLSR